MSTEDAPLPVAPDVPGPKPRILLVRAPYYHEVIEGLTWGALQILEQAGAAHETIDVAGSYELPQAIAMAIRADARFDGFVALGCVVRGGTDHYEHICRATLDGLMQVALATGCALGTGVLTVHKLKEAEKRSGRGGHNKGAEAAVAALRQVAIRRRFAASPARPVGFLSEPDPLSADAIG